MEVGGGLGAQLGTNPRPPEVKEVWGRFTNFQKIKQCILCTFRPK